MEMETPFAADGTPRAMKSSLYNCCGVPLSGAAFVPLVAPTSKWSTAFMVALANNGLEMCTVTSSPSVSW
jgi:hypothetical protein